MTMRLTFIAAASRKTLGIACRMGLAVLLVCSGLAGRSVQAQASAPSVPPGSAASAPTAACATSGYVLALQGLGGSSSPFAADWQTQAQASGGVSLVDEVPLRVYEGPQAWGRVTVLRWRCFEDAEASWKTLKPPTAGSGLLQTAALYRGVNYPDFPESMRRLPAHCVAPAYFMAVNTVVNAAQYDVYRQAMRQTDYVQRLGSTMLFSGTPVATLAGWPADTAASMTRWPCTEAFEQFYFDKTYVEQIKPLRAGAIDYRILGFKDADKPRASR
jgi:uncharacterized protein (DUF1330 family)